MPSWSDPIVISELLGVGLLAGYLNVVAGGGSLLAVPLLIFLGLPEGVANATSRLAIMTQSTTALAKYRATGKLDWALTRRLVPPALTGAGLGALAATRLSDGAFRAILGWVMIGCAALVVVEPFLLRARGTAAVDGGAETQAGDGGRDPASVLRIWLTMLAVGFYGGMVQAGMGYVVLAGLTVLLGLRLAEANVMKVVLVFAYTPLALAIFTERGMLYWPFGILLAFGQAAGGWLGAAAAMKRGETFVRVVLALVVLITAGKLLWTR